MRVVQLEVVLGPPRAEPDQTLEVELARLPREAPSLALPRPVAVDRALEVYPSDDGDVGRAVALKLQRELHLLLRRDGVPVLLGVALQHPVQLQPVRLTIGSGLGSGLG